MNIEEIVIGGTYEGKDGQVRKVERWNGTWNDKNDLMYSQPNTTRWSSMFTRNFAKWATKRIDGVLDGKN